MNRIAHHLTRATLIAAVLAAGFTVQRGQAAQQRDVRVVQLPTVTIVAKRIRVVELPRVVVTAKRLVPEPVLLAQRALRGVDAKPLAKTADKV